MKEVLIHQEEQEQFLIEFEEGDFEYAANFIVYEVTGWDKNGKTCDMEQYLKGYVKWDGCSHINFGHDEYPGYIHICGKYFWNLHLQVMVATWNLCEAKITGFDKKTADSHIKFDIGDHKETTPDKICNNCEYHRREGGDIRIQISGKAQMFECDKDPDLLTTIHCKCCNNKFEPRKEMQ